jgi:hypothetical protein
VISGKRKEGLTISAHANSNTFLQAAILAPIAVHSLDHALLVLSARSILDLLLNGAPKETLQVNEK